MILNPQVFLEECKYIVSEKKISRCINVDTDISSDDSNQEASDESGDSDEEGSSKEADKE